MTDRLDREAAKADAADIVACWAGRMPWCDDGIIPTLEAHYSLNGEVVPDRGYLELVAREISRLVFGV